MTELPPFETSVPGDPDAPGDIRRWTHTAARSLLPGLAEPIAEFAELLVANAVPRTPPGRRIKVQLIATGLGLRVEVTDPGQPTPGPEGAELAEISQRTRFWGVSCGASSHFAWAELRAEEAVA